MFQIPQYHLFKSGYKRLLKQKRKNWMSS